MEKKDVAIFLVHLFYIFLACVFHGHFLLCWVLAVLYFSGVVCICESFLQWSDVVIKMNLFMAGCFWCSYLGSVSSGSWRMYDLCSAHLLVSGFHFPIWLSNICTSCPRTGGGRSWAVLSWYIFCISCLCFSSSWIWSVLKDLGVETLAIKFDLKMQFFKSSAGLGRVWLIGVLHKHSIAKLGSLPACLVLIRALLIVWICLLIKPFDFGNFGDDVMWSNCHCWENSLHASLEYCGPLSLTTLLGIPCSENTCFIVDMTIIVRPFIFCIIGNLL